LMATAAATPQITKCPPGAALNATFDEYSHASCHKTANYVVRSSYRGLDRWESTGFSFDDATVHSADHHKLNLGRKEAPPEWAFNTTKMRALIVRQVELRAGLLYPQPGDERTRLAHAQQQLKVNRPKLEVLLNRFCSEYAAEKQKPQPDASRLTVLEEQIAIHDQRIRTDESCAGIIARIIQLYYGAGQDSVAIAEALKISPPNVRQLLHKLNKTWLRMQHEPAPVALNQLFDEVRSRMIDSERSHCKQGHPTCIENALPSALLRCGVYRCRECVNTYNHRRLNRYKPQRKPTHGDTNSPDAKRRRAKLSQGLCGKGGCQNPRWEGRPECEMHTLYYRERARAYQQKQREARVTRQRQKG
jgi:hypothetical protein